MDHRSAMHKSLCYLSAPKAQTITKPPIVSVRYVPVKCFNRMCRASGHWIYIDGSSRRLDLLILNPILRLIHHGSSPTSSRRV